MNAWEDSVQHRMQPLRAHAAAVSIVTRFLCRYACLGPPFTLALDTEMDPIEILNGGGTWTQVTFMLVYLETTNAQC